MFNPKITPGHWIIDSAYEGESYCDAIGPLRGSENEYGMIFGDVKDDLKATAAVPELLEVYKMARNVLSSKSEEEDAKRLCDLTDAVNTLEGRHCDRN